MLLLSAFASSELLGHVGWCFWEVPQVLLQYVNPSQGSLGNAMNSFQTEIDTDPFSAEVSNALLLRETDPAEAIKLLEALSKEGSPVAAHSLADIYAFGRYGAAADKEKAIQFFNQAIDSGSLEASYRLARYYESINEIPKAVALLEELSQRGFVQADFLLGTYYYDGKLLQKNYVKSLLFFERAADGGHLYGRQWVGHLLLKKGGVVNWIKGTAIIASTAVSLLRADENDDRLRQW